MIIDMFAHIRGPKYSNELEKLTGEVNRFPNPIRDTMEGRFESIEKQCPNGYTSVLSTMMENIPRVEDEIALCHVANDEYIELCEKYPKYFLSAAALLPTSDMKAAVKEAERALAQLGLKGLLVGTHVTGDLLGHEKMFELYDLASQYDVPIWIHPYHRFPEADFSPFDYSCETGKTMMDLSTCGIFEKHPEIKFIVHHGGGVVPLMYPRMKAMYYNSKQHIYDPALSESAEPSKPLFPNERIVPRRWTAEQGIQYFENLKRFYFDTAYDGIASDAMELRIKFFGIDKALFSGDFPGGPTMETSLSDSIKTIEGLSASEKDKQKVYTENAKKLLKL